MLIWNKTSGNSPNLFILTEQAVFLSLQPDIVPEHIFLHLILQGQAPCGCPCKGKTPEPADVMKKSVRYIHPPLLYKHLIPMAYTAKTLFLQQNQQNQIKEPV